ncbi:unnamed protein product [Urochloa decumbens]|uniref:F-box domain-containing protein n=1 Tax=Urochloa decumbens TaxID=240449 RepID=A0ABC9BCI7_9POAL
MATSSPWTSSLPQKIVAAVLRRLPSHADRVRFAAVCRPWRAAAARHPLPPLPWLALPDGTFFSFPSSAALRFPGAGAGGGGYQYHGSCDDWLLFNGGAAGSDGEGYLLANPFTGATARLPPLSRVRFAFGDGGGAALAWRGIADDRRAPRGVTVRKLAMCSGGRLVAALVGAEAGHVLVVPQRRRPVAVVRRPGVRRRQALRRHVEGAGVGRPCPSARQVHYLVPSGGGGGGGGELLMVRRRFPHAGVGDGGASRFEVLRADLEEQRWEAVRSLGYAGEEALFVSRLCSRVVRGRHLRGDEIFFLPDDCAGMSFWGPRRRRGDHHAAVYDMWAGTVTYLMPRQPGDDDDDDDDDRHTMATWLFHTSATTARRDALKNK